MNRSKPERSDLENGIRIAIASGKGGTGKTTVAVNLAKMFGSRIQIADCDVEEPNVHLFLGGDCLSDSIVTLPVPRVNETLCNGCGECGRFCAYHAIVSFGKKPILFPELCHGCGGCMKVCPEKAIDEVEKPIGSIRTMQAGDLILVQGQLDIGVAMAPPIIRALREELDGTLPVILDAPPGTSCPVIAAVQDTDFVVLVTEPTPFGLHDLTLAVDMVRHLGLSFGVVVNRMGVGDDRVHGFCEREGISILTQIPDDRRIAEAYSNGRLIVDALPEYRMLFSDLKDRIMARCRARRT